MTHSGMRFRRYTTAFAMAFALAGASIGQMLPSGPSGGDVLDLEGKVVDGPAIKFETLEHDFGVISDLEPVTFEFKFVNAGNGLLTLDQVKPSCGCTAAELTIRDFLPGEGGSIPITFNPQGREGVQPKTIRVVSNDPNHPMLTLSITSTVKPAVDAPKVVNMADVIKGLGGTERFEILSDRETFEVKGVESVGPNITAKIVEQGTVETETGPKHRVVIEATVDGEAPMGYLSRHVNLNTVINDDHGQTIDYVVSVPIQANIVGDLNVQPGRVMLGTPEAGAVVQRQFTLASRTGKPFKVLEYNYETENDMSLDITHEVETAEDGSPLYRFYVDAGVPGEPGLFRGTIRIKTDSELMPELQVPFYGTVRGRPLAPNRDEG